MAYYCIDPTNGNDATGASNAVQSVAETTPYKTIQGAEADTTPPTGGDSILLKGGVLSDMEYVAASTTTGTAGNRITIGSYGVGKGGFDGGNSLRAMRLPSSNVYITLKNIELTGGDGTGSDCLYLPASTDATPKNIIVDGCEIHDPVPNDNSGSGTGIDIRSADNKVFDTHIYNTPDDGIYCEGVNAEISYCHIHDVDQHPTNKGGDCVKFSGAADSATAGHAHHNILDHSKNNRKQALIMEGGALNGGGDIGEHNWCSGGEFTINSKGAGNIIRRNLVHPKTLGSEYGAEITNTRGINVQNGANQIIESNIIHVINGEKPNWLIRSLSLSTKIQGNIAYGELNNVFGNEASIHLEVGAGNDTVIYNNIIGGHTNGRHLVTSNTVNLTPANVDYNIYTEDGTWWVNGTFYANFLAWQAAGYDANSVIIPAATLFEDLANGDFRIKNGQHIYGKQLGYKDFLGRVNSPMIIGAYNIRSKLNADRGLATDRGIATDRGLATDRGQIDTQYPEWGIRAA